MSTETQMAPSPQPDCPKSEPQLQHEWLHKMVGEWECEGEATMAPDQPPAKWKATETVRSVGGLWIIAEGSGDMPGGGKSSMVLTLGYDPAKQRFVGTFIASMMTHMWVYNGSLDEGQKVLTLDTEGPSPDGSTARYQDVIEIRDENERTLSSYLIAADGQRHRFMHAVYRRKS